MRKGFTLLELLTVVIIIAILASIALPQFFKIAERGRAAEGIHVLGVIRSAQLRYCAEHGSTTDNINNLDVTLPATLKYFNAPNLISFDCSNATDTQEVANIQRNNKDKVGKYANYTLKIQKNGDIVCKSGTCPPGTTTQ